MSTENRSPLKAYSAKPCQEDWANRSPCGENRFCVKCNKTVFDFTTKTPEEIIAIHKEHGGRVCGKYLKSQLTPRHGVYPMDSRHGVYPMDSRHGVYSMDSSSLPPRHGVYSMEPSSSPRLGVYPKDSRLGVYSKDSSSSPRLGSLAQGSSPWTLVQGYKLPFPRLGLLAPGIKALTVASLTCITPAVAQVLPTSPIHQEIPSQESTPKPAPTINQDPVCPIYKIKGTISDSSKEGLIGAVVLINGNSQGTVTDIYGKFELDVSREMMYDSMIVVSVFSTGYQPFEKKIYKADFRQRKMHLELILNTQIVEEIFMVGEVVVLPKHKRIMCNIKYKLKRLFR